jgi:hypothetical protein
VTRHLTPVRMAVIKNNKCWWRYADSHRWRECNLVQTLWEIVQRFLKQLKIKLGYNPEIPLLDIHPKEIKSICQRDSFTPMVMNSYSQQPS